MYQYQIDHVRKVTNGDTLHLIVDLGFYTSTEVAVRLLGVEVPEFGTFDRQGVDKGAAARNFTIEWFKTQPGPFILHTTRDRRDGFQRWLGTIFDANGADLNTAISEQGFAKSYDA